MQIELTRDAYKLLVLLYKRYLERRSEGVSKSLARRFGNVEDVRCQLLLSDQPDDVLETLRELSRSKMIFCVYGDDSVVFFDLTDQAIIAMENRFRNGVSDVLDFIGKIPFL